jgi:peptidoglycan/xylan/chitin deacetylase (PgdA/CDA1 family)
MPNLSLRQFTKPSILLREALLLIDRIAPGAGVPVLCYHKIAESGVDRHPLAVSRQRFTEHMESLVRAGYRTVPAVEALHGTKRGDRVLALTFDDGHADALEIAAPVLARFGFRATVFPVTEWIGRDGWLDHRSGNRLEAPRDPADLPTRFLGWEELKALRRQGWDVGAHTCSHAPLRDLAPLERRRELVDARREIEARLGGTIELFAYPYRGYSPEVAGEVRAAGYRVAFSLEAGLNGPDTDPMNARRAGVRGWNDVQDIRLRLSGQYAHFRRIAGTVERQESPSLTSPVTASRDAVGGRT